MLIQLFITLTLCFTDIYTLEDGREAKILDYQLEHTGTGHYFFRFESSDGTTREEEGNVVNDNPEDSPVVVRGSYSYTDETGKIYTVRYVADENGFHPEGDHIQVPAYVINPNPVKILLPTQRTVTPIPIPYVPTTIRPAISTEPTRIQIPLESKKKVTINSPSGSGIDEKLQKTIVNLIENGRGFGF